MNRYEQHEADARYVTQLRSEVGELKEKVATLEKERDALKSELRSTQDKHAYWYSLANKFRLQCDELKVACKSLASVVATWRIGDESQPAPAQEVQP